MSFRFFFRNALEYFAIVFIWWCTKSLIDQHSLSHLWLLTLIVVLSWSKTLFFGIENLQQLLHASQKNMAYHHFMLLMLVNMSQIILSFGFDYHCLQRINGESLGGINPEFTQAELVFECVYYSLLNFTFFGYGDITPQTIPAKLLTMTEITLAFVTVIFLLSDFISLKESIIGKRNGDESIKR